MFNINSLAEGMGNLYDIKKKRIVHAMKSDQSEKWKRRAQRFEVFRPKHEKPQPSEWYIPLYVALHPTAILGFLGAVDTRGQSSVERSGGSNRPAGLWARFSHVFRQRRPPAVKETVRSDEGWVL